jgi:hypothetical protein
MAVNLLVKDRSRLDEPPTYEGNPDPFSWGDRDETGVSG